MNTQEIKGLVFFDLDGTLLDSSGRVAPSTLNAIQALKANHYLPVVNTGRSLSEFGTLGKETGIDTLVLLNGMEVYHQGKNIFSITVPNAVTEKLLHFAHTQGHEIGYYMAGGTYLSGMTPAMQAHFDYFDIAYQGIDPEAYKTHDVPMLFVASPDAHQDEDYAVNNPELAFFRNSPYSMDVTLAGFDKGKGVREIIDLLNLPEDIPTYAFGDGLNDTTMFQAVQYPIAMGNARDELKALATFISTTNDEHGIENGLRHYDLI
jgi:Cof subfamily protein (haloacid dehalogenase superfamily)